MMANVLTLNFSIICMTEEIYRNNEHIIEKPPCNSDIFHIKFLICFSIFFF
ncbi:unnamed protein product [Dracunculus medinensis]|uniref:Uncharacterized protein n=1 Tax=Dracunculus medinensis TaxID=318479 RepID=A0A0N4U5N9_DRAME|nr:unnamed protein product [Dracunculus medinensis]